MKIEFEVKYYINIASFLHMIQDLDAKKIIQNTLMKRYNFTHSSFKNCSLRVRDEGNRVTMTYKVFGNQRTIDSVKEVEIVVDSFDRACLMLESLGYEKLRYVENYREIWSLQDCFFMIDQWPGLDPFVEIEGPSAESVYKMIELCNLDSRQAMFGSTAYLYEQKYGISLEKFDQIDRLDFDTDFEKLLKKV